jgi:putative spermidine/putrescine transport system ATP-binding protein
VTDVTLEGVRIEREGRVVLDVPALSLRSKRTTAILGPNGSGKTTLLRAIARLEQHGGRISIAGSQVQTQRHLAYVFQEEVFLRQSVRRNLELGLQLRAIGRDERRQRIEDAARLVSIEPLLERRADRLSGGEGRRVSLARALCLRAPVVLLDEPLAGLDEGAYARLIDELPRIVEAFDATTILVTHSRDEALRLADDLIVLVDGKVRRGGGTQEVAANPRVDVVAEVLGYTLLVTPSQCIAVPPGALRVGGGQPEFSMVVERVLDMVGVHEIAGRIGDAPVRVPLGASETRPMPGDRMTVHPIRFCEVD